MTTRGLLPRLAGMGAGAAAWTLTEYVMHRGAFHAGPTSAATRLGVDRVHRDHHREPLATIPLARVLGHLAIGVVGVAGGRLIGRILAGGPTAGGVRAAAQAGGVAWSAGYSAYDLVHHRLHHRPPSTSVGRRLRAHHFRHHFGANRTNLGVTTPVWDRVFGTAADPKVSVRVPAHHAPEWLDDLGAGFTTSPVAALHDR